MRIATWRRLAIAGVGLGLASCGGRDGVGPQSPSAPGALPTSAGLATGFVMESSQGLAPEGFKFAMKLDPRPSGDGIIHADSPIAVEVDLCGSTADPGRTLRFLFDWDFNHVPDIVGTGDACHQKHTYRVPKDATRDVVLETNVCVTNGDPNVHDGSTYFSCRTIRVGLPKSTTGNCVLGDGLPAGCQDGFFGGVPFSIAWAGGRGPHDAVEGFDGFGCQPGDLQGLEDGVVFACSQAEAAELCGGLADGPGGTNFSGLQVFFCGGPPLTTHDAQATVRSWNGR
jgi:hypothetical protein